MTFSVRAQEGFRVKGSGSRVVRFRAPEEILNQRGTPGACRHEGLVCIVVLVVGNRTLEKLAHVILALQPPRNVQSCS